MQMIKVKCCFPVINFKNVGLLLEHVIQEEMIDLYLYPLLYWIPASQRPLRACRQLHKAGLMGIIATRELTHHWEPEDNSVRWYQEGLIKLVRGFGLVLSDFREDSRKHRFLSSEMLSERGTHLLLDILIVIQEARGID